MINMPFTHLSKCDWNVCIFILCQGQLLASGEVGDVCFQGTESVVNSLLLCSAQPDNLYSAARGPARFLSLIHFPRTLTFFMASFHCLYWILSRRKEI